MSLGTGLTQLQLAYEWRDDVGAERYAAARDAQERDLGWPEILFDAERVVPGRLRWWYSVPQDCKLGLRNAGRTQVGAELG